MNRVSKRLHFKDHGVGVGLRKTHFDVFLSAKPKNVQWLEALTENFFPLRGEKHCRALRTLEKLRPDYEIAIHGVGMSLASTDPLNLRYMKQLRDLKSRVRPMWVSDHLCWTGVGGESFHDLLPVPYDRKTLKFVADKISQAQDLLGERMLIENLSSYVDFTSSDMTEWEFLSELVEVADCGLLLDVNNIYVSSVNHEFDPLEYLRAIRPERVAQIHLAGHSERKGFLLDTHDAPICDNVWDLYRWTLENIGSKSTMIERDGNIPDWNELSKEIEILRNLRAQKNQPVSARATKNVQPSA